MPLLFVDIPMETLPINNSPHYQSAVIILKVYTSFIRSLFEWFRFLGPSEMYFMVNLVDSLSFNL